MSKKVPEAKNLAQKLEQFEQLVAWFDTEDFSLSTALTKFEEAEKLARDIETELNGVKNQVEVLKTKFDQPDA